MSTSRPLSEDTSPSGDSEPLRSLSARADLPPRVRALLDGLLERTSAYFEDAVRQALDETEHALFKLAERAGSSARQQRCLDDLREIKNRRADVAPRFVQHAESRLADLRLPRHGSAAAAAPSAAAAATLQLVETDALEEDLALQQIASKSEIRSSQALYALSHRLGVVAGTPAWANDVLPLGPAQLVAALRYALRGLSLQGEHRLLAYRQFDRIAMLPIGTLYDDLNAWLVEGRVLPHFRIQPARPRSESATARRGASAAATEPSAGTDDRELFDTLRSLLAARRRSEDPPGAAAALPKAGRDELQGLLGVLQHDSLARSASYDAEHFRNTLLVKLRRLGPQGQPLGLSDEDSDTVDLIGLLFDYIVKNARGGAGTQALLTRLHVPVLRVALGDKSFFTRRGHPARELLNTIAETSSHWADEPDAGADLIGRMQLAVEQVGTEFNGDLGVFENLMADLDGHMRLLARRADVAERRHVDAARGRDRLEVARRSARSAIAQVLERATPTPAVRALLEQAWCDALALSALREGEDGSEFRRRLAVAEALTHGMQAAPAHDRDMVRADLETGLRQVGLHDDDIAALIDGTLPAADADVASETARQRRVDEVLGAAIRFGADAEKTAAAPSAPLPLAPAETALLAELRGVPFGTWFEFVVNQQGDILRRKLAWFSTVTGRCLFVNQRGARAEDKTLEQLARDIARGQARIAVAESSSLIDRAWKAITDLLRRPAGAER